MPEERQLKLYAPELADDEALFVRRLTGKEGLSQLFTYDVELLARSESVDLDAVLGGEMVIGLELPDERERFFHGYVADFSFVGADGDDAVYRAHVVPHLWRLDQTTNCRIFQKQTVPEIVEQIFGEHRIPDVDVRLNQGNRGPYLPWDYCVQYRETDLAFVSRLLEHEGIHYFFEHARDRHVLVLMDASVTHTAVEGYEAVTYSRTPRPRQASGERVWSWRVAKRVLPGRHTLRDFDYLTPNADLTGTSGSEVERRHDKIVPPDYENYDHPETVVQQQGYNVQLLDDYARIRTEALHARYEVATAATNARGLTAGAMFRLEEGPREGEEDREYLVLSSRFRIVMDSRRSEGAGDGSVAYTCSFEAIDQRHPFRPPRVTRKPIISGPQSATVVGKAGQDIWTDEHGRVRVKFHWDRDDRPGEERSCWVRVSQSWAGSNWGAMFLPHCGQEVLVGFIEGDPDRPVVVGRVYNGTHHPPLDLPANAHKSIIRDHFGNELIMDGTSGKEHISLHSPSHYSVLQLGKSIKTFTRSKEARYSFDSESYHFGYRNSFTRGATYSVEASNAISIKRGMSWSATIGADARLSAGANLSFTAGTQLTLLMGQAFTFGFSRELRTTKGSYQRKAAGNLLLDSNAKIFVTGGENDNTMLMSDDHELTLSYDESSSTRTKAYESAERWAKGRAVISAAAATTAAQVGAAQYQSDVSGVGPRCTGDGSVEEIDADYQQISSLMTSDAIVLGGAAAGVVGAILPVAPLPEPKHPTPSAKIILKKEHMTLFAGEGKEAKITLTKQGISLVADDRILLKSQKKTIGIQASEDILMKAKNVVIKGKINHPNFKVQ